MIAQVFYKREEFADTQRRIRHGKKVSGHIIKQTILMLHMADKIRRGNHPLKYQRIMVIFAILVQIGSCKVRKLIDCRFCLVYPIFLHKTAILWISHFHILKTQCAQDTLIRILNHFFIMLSHNSQPSFHW